MSYTHRMGLEPTTSLSFHFYGERKCHLSQSSLAEATNNTVPLNPFELDFEHHYFWNFVSAYLSIPKFPSAVRPVFESCKCILGAKWQRRNTLTSKATCVNDLCVYIRLLMENFKFFIKLYIFSGLVCLSTYSLYVLIGGTKEKTVCIVWLVWKSNNCVGKFDRYDWLAKKNLRTGYFIWAMTAYGLGMSC